MHTWFRSVIHGQGFCTCRVKRYNSYMAMMLSRTYEAFKAAGVSDDKVRGAASRLTGIESRLVRLEVMMALILAGVASLVVKAF